MSDYIVKLKKRDEVASATMAFYFERPKGFDFTAGQHMTVGLLNSPETDDAGDKRTFCLANAPYEQDLMVAMRMRDTAFKGVLKTIPLGSAIEISDARGSFVLHDDISKPAVFLVGGIGITPIRSMLFQAAHDKLKQQFYLFYSNRTREDAAFLDELEGLRSASMNYKLMPVMSDTEGYIDRAKLDAHLDSLTNKLYYAVGPSGFVLAMRGLLNELGVNSDDIKTDQFAGY